MFVKMMHVHTILTFLVQSLPSWSSLSGITVMEGLCSDIQILDKETCLIKIHAVFTTLYFIPNLQLGPIS
jgi:hypothetical protein